MDIFSLASDIRARASLHIYVGLHLAQEKNNPAINYLELVQKFVSLNPKTMTICDGLFRTVPDTWKARVPLQIRYRRILSTTYVINIQDDGREKLVSLSLRWTMKPKGDIKELNPTKSIFCRVFLCLYGSSSEPRKSPQNTLFLWPNRDLFLKLEIRSQNCPIWRSVVHFWRCYNYFIFNQ